MVGREVLFERREREGALGEDVVLALDGVGAEGDRGVPRCTMSR